VRIKAIIFDVDGTLADTEEAHREAFHSAFAEHRLDWHWSTSDYARWLGVTGGKERLAAFVESLPLSSEERAALKARIPAIHRTKSDHYARLVRMGRVPLRAGIKRLLKEAESAGVTLAIASTTTRENIDALLGAHFGEGATGRFSVIGAGDAGIENALGLVEDTAQNNIVTIVNRSADFARAIACALGNRAKSAGVVRFTRTSVHWAERIVATRS